MNLPWQKKNVRKSGRLHKESVESWSCMNLRSMLHNRENWKQVFLDKNNFLGEEKEGRDNVMCVYETKACYH